jgi:hypothetical protein
MIELAGENVSLHRWPPPERPQICLRCGCQRRQQSRVDTGLPGAILEYSSDEGATWGQRPACPRRHEFGPLEAQ